MATVNKKFHYASICGLGLTLLSCIASAMELGQVDNWDVDGANGSIYVHGALTESACRLAMSSAYQTVDLGNLGTGQLQKVNQAGNRIPVNLVLEDCMSGENRSRNKLGNLLWSQDMPAIKIRFLSPSDAQDPRLAAVTGIQGMGLRISDGMYNPIHLGQYSTPQLISPGQNKLTYYITPVRTTAGLNAGSYSALIRFQVSYD
ncbi:type 1 fimbrial protein [Providencia rettgeri]|nr:type 1 fimbrial protein [Providencia rettgeri]ELL9156004.1 type 1 fimbrial protein [Providencia rettgeri]ELR5153085.1 type 1 fimbrial protein [Providencia rettgeri]